MQGFSGDGGYCTPSRESNALPRIWGVWATSIRPWKCWTDKTHSWIQRDQSDFPSWEIKTKSLLQARSFMAGPSQHVILFVSVKFSINFVCIYLHLLLASLKPFIRQFWHNSGMTLNIWCLLVNPVNSRNVCSFCRCWTFYIGLLLSFVFDVIPPLCLVSLKSGHLVSILAFLYRLQIGASATRCAWGGDCGALFRVREHCAQSRQWGSNRILPCSQVPGAIVI